MCSNNIISRFHDKTLGCDNVTMTEYILSYYPQHRIVPSLSNLVTTIAITRASELEPPSTTVIEHKTVIEYLEHVVIEVTLNLSSELDPDHFYDYNDYFVDNDVLEHKQPRRGDISIDLESPQGTTSTVLPYRELDYINTVGYVKWPFSSLHFWGEDPVGYWKLTVHYRSPVGQVEVNDLKMKLYGSKSTPESVKRIPGQCASECARGCASAKENHCDSCKKLSDPITLECIPLCPNGTIEVNGYCINHDGNFTYKYKPEVDKHTPSVNPDADELPKLPDAFSPTTTTASIAMATTTPGITVTSIPGLDDSHFVHGQVEGVAEKQNHSAAGLLGCSLLFLLTLTAFSVLAM